MSIIAALSSASIHRLSSTMKIVKRNLFLYRKYEECAKLMDSSKGYHKYREALKSTATPAIPYLGVFLRDFIYLNEFYADKSSDGRINILKLVKFGLIVHSLMCLKSHEYPKFNNQNLHSFILESQIYDQEVIYKI